VFIHLQEGICGNTHKRAKNVQEDKAQLPFNSSQRKEAWSPGKSGPKHEENHAKSPNN
jgi:hypothetical protein